MKRISIAAAALLLSGCSLAHIAVPAELGTAPRLPVSGLQGISIGQRITFGPYTTERVRRTPTELREREGIISTRGEHRQEYWFDVREEGASIAAVDCTVDAVATATSLPGNVEMSGVRSARVGCVLTPEGEGERWTLALASRGGNPLQGTLASEDASFDVAATAVNPESRCCETAGFYLRRRGRAVGAVEVINGGAVWLAPELGDDERRIVASAAAALLALQELGDDYTRER